MCVRGIDFASVSKIFRLDFETVPTVILFYFITTTTGIEFNFFFHKKKNSQCKFFPIAKLNYY
jgi:hypothetical protein